jgi:hypothetical protein
LTGFLDFGSIFLQRLFGFADTQIAQFFFFFFLYRNPSSSVQSMDGATLWTVAGLPVGLVATGIGGI